MDHLAGAECMVDADTGEYWLAGIWDANGALVWSSEPESYDTEAEARAAANAAMAELDSHQD